MASFTAAVIRAAVSTTEKAVVVVGVTDLIPAVTEGMIIADSEITLVCCWVALVVIRTVSVVLQTSAARDTGHSVTVVAVVGVGVGVRHVAETVVHSALLAGPTAAHVRGTAGRVTVGAVGAILSEVSTA